MTAFAEPTAEDLRDVAILAEVWLHLDAAREYGFIEGGPDVNVQRCEEIIERAHAAGHVWTTADVEAAIPAVLAAE